MASQDRQDPGCRRLKPDRCCSQKCPAVPGSGCRQSPDLLAGAFVSLGHRAFLCCRCSSLPTPSSMLSRWSRSKSWFLWITCGTTQPNTSTSSSSARQPLAPTAPTTLACTRSGRVVRYPVIRYFSGVHSERQLKREIQVNVAYRWLMDLNRPDNEPDTSTLSLNLHRHRLWHKDRTNGL